MVHLVIHSAIWRGCQSPAFKRFEGKETERDPTRCMSIISSERILDIVWSSEAEMETMYNNIEVMVRMLKNKVRFSITAFIVSCFCILHRD